MKKVLYVLLALVVIYLILCAAGPSDMGAPGKVTMKASPAAILEECTDFNKVHVWSPWMKMDTAMQTTVSGTPNEVGHRNEWKSDKMMMGDGAQWITEIKPGESMRIALLFGESPDTMYSYINTVPNGDSTTVTWGMDEHKIPFLMRGMALFGPSMEDVYNEGLNSLKVIAEAKPATPAAVAFEVTDTPDQWYVGKLFSAISFVTTPEDVMMKMYSDTYTEIGTWLGSMKISPTGQPMSIAHNFDEKTMSADLEIAMPVADSVNASGALRCMKIPGGRSASYEYVGGYGGVVNAWDGFMTSVMKDHQPRWSGYEIYVIGPGTEPDSTKWVTQLVQPIQ